jgi:hypothetical protein
MADVEVSAEIIFDDDHKLQTRSTPQEIQNRIIGFGASGEIPLIEVELPNGESALVNAAHIREIRSARPPDPGDYRTEST